MNLRPSLCTNQTRTVSDVVAFSNVTDGRGWRMEQQMSKTPPYEEVPFRDRISCTIEQACEATGLGRTKLYMLMDAGVLKSVTVGRRRLVLMESLIALLQPDEKPKG